MAKSEYSVSAARLKWAIRGCEGSVGEGEGSETVTIRGAETVVGSRRDSALWIYVVDYLT